MAAAPGRRLFIPHFSCQGDLGQPEPLCNANEEVQARNLLSVAVSRDGGAFADLDVIRAAPTRPSRASSPGRSPVCPTRT